MTGLAAVGLTDATGGLLAAAAVHTVAMLAMMALVAVAVYDHAGVAILRRAWVNLDLLWAGALVAAGLFALSPEAGRRFGSPWVAGPSRRSGTLLRCLSRESPRLVRGDSHDLGGGGRAATAMDC